MDQLLQKLEKKPIQAEKEKDFLIQIPKKEQEIPKEEEKIVGEEGTQERIIQEKKPKIKIIDRTNIDFDRDNILRKIKRKIKVRDIQEKTPEKQEPEKEETKVEEPEEELEEEPKKVIKKVKKLIIKPTEEEEQPIEKVEEKTVEKTEKPKKKVIIKKKKLMPKVDKKVVAEYPLELLDIEGVTMDERYKKREKNIVKASSYYLNNREIFIEFINQIFYPYKREVEGEIEGDNSEGLYTHQKLVRDYMNIYTPYRGLLLYHGLGSGKTCSSIAIAEGLKTEKQIVVMTPASLRMNYIEQLKECGDILYKKNQFWEFIKVSDISDYISSLSNLLNLKEDYIRKNKGVWLVNMKKKSNYESLNNEERLSLDKQLNEMIRGKYQFINYNGLRDSHLNSLSNNDTINPFDNKVIIIDEVHNFVSRIVNKLKRKSSLSLRLYNYLLNAKNCKLVFLTGTPIINYPNEIAVLFNMLRGYIKTWHIPIINNSGKKINQKFFEDLFSKYAMLDYLEYKPSSKTLIITKNPFGFIKRIQKGEYKGVKFDERGQINENSFQRFIINKLKKNDLDVLTSGIKIDLYKALPDNFDEFKNLFIKEKKRNDIEITNENMLKRRILGLTSYFRSAQESLLPRYNKNEDFHVLKVPMSEYQFGVYEVARQDERKQESGKKKKATDDLYKDSVSTYRIFSRAFCNFVFPPEFSRPMPKDNEELKEAVQKSDEYDIDGANIEERLNNPDGKYTLEDREQLKEEMKEEIDETYEQRIQNALNYLKENEEKYLTPEGLKIYGPKLLQVLENIQETIGDKDKDGIHLIYSQFRTLEGIGILKLVLEANSFSHFKILKDENGEWKLNMTEAEKNMPSFALYTGTETTEEKEIIRNICNNEWEYVPSSLVDELKTIHNNNLFGEVIKILMITSSGAEGIDLKNIRYVHIMESYWHPVRMEQVIGRAVRIKSHIELPEKYRNVEVYLYLMTFTEEQINSDQSIELRLKDKSKINPSIPLTSDEALYEISNIKENINNQLLTNIKEASVDCATYSKNNTKEGLVCFSFGKVAPEKMAYTPSYRNQEKDKDQGLNLKTISWKAVTFNLGGKKYKLRLKDDGKTQTDEVYDFESYEQAKNNPNVKPIFIGKLVRTGKKARIERI